MRIRETAQLAQKFATRAAAAAGDYKTGVEASGQDWLNRTLEGEENYANGVNAAIAQKRFGKGVAAAGVQKFVQRASQMGSQRFAPGVQNAQGEWQKNTEPYLAELRGMNLPPRRPKGDPGNQARAAAVAQRLRDVKLAR